jgi:hypothetical protein
MPLVYSHERHIFRVDGDVLETFIRGESEQRVLLAWLAVQAFPLARGYLAIQIGSAPTDMPLYEVLPKAKAMMGRGTSTVQLSISREEEPVIREFFTQVAQLCGRPLVP